LTIKEDDTEHRWAAFIRQHARVITDINDFVEHDLWWQFHFPSALEERLVGPGMGHPITPELLPDAKKNNPAK